MSGCLMRGAGGGGAGAVEDHVRTLEGRTAKVVQCEKSCSEMTSMVEGPLQAPVRKEEASADREKARRQCAAALQEE